MNTLLEELHFDAPLVRVLIGLLPYFPAPVVCEPARASSIPRGCLYLPTVQLVLAAADGLIGPAILAADALARSAKVDVILVSIRSVVSAQAVRFDVVLAGDSHTEHASDLLFWRLKNRAPALIPTDRRRSSVVFGRSGLIPSFPPPYAGPVERLTGLAFGGAELRRTLWDEVD